MMSDPSFGLALMAIGGVALLAWLFSRPEKRSEPAPCKGAHTMEYTGEARQAPKARRCTKCPFVEPRTVYSDGSVEPKAYVGPQGDLLAVYGVWGQPMVGDPFDQRLTSVLR